MEHLPLAVWEAVGKAMNTNLAKGRDNSSKLRYWARRVVTTDEVLQFYGYIVLIENTYGNNTAVLKDHFSDLKQHKPLVHAMSWERFRALKTAFYGPDELIREICLQFHAATNKWITEVEEATADEIVIEYKPSKKVKDHFEQLGIPIPVVYFPRKPHPNGLEDMALMTFVEHPGNPNKKLPYMLDLLPHLVVGDCAPIACVQQFMKQWIQPTKPVFVVDAGFSSYELVKEINTWGGDIVMSSSENTLSALWGALSFGLTAGHWHAAVDKDGRVASCHCITTEKGDKTYQYVIASNATATPFELPSTTISTPSTNSTTTPAPNQSSDDMPLFTIEVLQKMTVETLKALCTKYNVKHGRKKDGYVNNLHKRSMILNNNRGQVEMMMNQLENVQLEDPAPINNFYKTHFNYIDLTDRRWNSVEEHHANLNWRSKMVQVILRFVVINAWAHASNREYQKFKKWHHDLGVELCNFGL